jgi:hypothetical protein
MQELDFGTIEALVVHDGLPVFEPQPRITCDRRCGGANGNRPEVGLDDFVLKEEVLDLIRELAEMGESIVTRIEVKHGLPFRVQYPVSLPLQSR